MSYGLANTPGGAGAGTPKPGGHGVHGRMHDDANRVSLPARPAPHRTHMLPSLASSSGGAQSTRPIRVLAGAELPGRALLLTGVLSRRFSGGRELREGRVGPRLGYRLLALGGASASLREWAIAAVNMAWRHAARHAGRSSARAVGECAILRVPMAMRRTMCRAASTCE